jgi:hypothetical protein
VLALSNIYTNQEAIDARDTLAFCEFSSQLSSECGDAQLRWDDAIGYAWSLSAIGLLLMVGTVVVVEKPLEDGSWPSQSKDLAKAEETKTPVKQHHVKRSGSWRSRGSEEE